MSSSAFLGPWLDYTINGLVVGNIYALLAVGLALIYGVSHLINFAHGSIYMVGAYVGWLCVTYLGTPLPVTLLAVVIACGLLGMAVERIALRSLQSSPRIAPLLSTIGVGLVLDQVAQLLFTPDPRGIASQVPSWRIQIGGGTIGALDLLIAGIGLTSALLLYAFLRFTKLGWAVRATAFDRDAAQQCGVDVNRVNSAVFAIAAALGGVSGFLVGMYYNSIDPNMGYQAGLKGIVAQMIGGMGNVPGAIAGSLLLGLIESYGIAIFGTSYRNLFAFVVMILILVLKPNGIFSRGRRLPPEPLTGTFIAPSAPLHVPTTAVVVLAVLALALPLVVRSGYVLQTLGIGWLYAILAISLTLVAGTAGQISLGHAGLLAIGAYASALLAIDLRSPGGRRRRLRRPGHRGARHPDRAAVVPAAGALCHHRHPGNWRDRDPRDPQLGQPYAWPHRLDRHPAAIGVRLARRQRHVGLRDIAGGAVGAGAPAAPAARLASGAHPARHPRRRRGGTVLRRLARSLQEHRLCGAGFSAGIAGALMAHIFSYVNHETFTSHVSLAGADHGHPGGLGNIAGGIVGAVLLVSLPELFRAAAEYRLLIYGIALLVLIRFRPQGLFGTV